MSNSLRPPESQHARPPCPSPPPGVHSDSHPSSRWCHPAISSSVVPFSSCPQSLPASESSNESTLCMRWPKYWNFSFSIIPSKEIPKCSTWVQSQKWQNDLCSFPWEIIQYHANPSLCPISNAKEAEVEWFYENLQDLLELTPKKDVLFFPQGTGMQK